MKGRRKQPVTRPWFSALSGLFRPYSGWTVISVINKVKASAGTACAVHRLPPFPYLEVEILQRHQPLVRCVRKLESALFVLFPKLWSQRFEGLSRTGTGRANAIGIWLPRRVVASVDKAMSVMRTFDAAHARGTNAETRCLQFKANC
jgi:hypothetical protein